MPENKKKSKRLLKLVSSYVVQRPSKGCRKITNSHSEALRYYIIVVLVSFVVFSCMGNKYILEIERKPILM